MAVSFFGLNIGLLLMVLQTLSGGGINCTMCLSRILACRSPEFPEPGLIHRLSGCVPADMVFIGLGCVSGPMS